MTRKERQAKTAKRAEEKRKAAPKAAKGWLLSASGNPDNAHRWPLAAGHRVTWGAITKGTSLEGVPYPYDVREAFR